MLPVSLFAYRRPRHLARTLGGLRANRIERIYAFSDGPRSEAERAGVEEVREQLRAIDWAEVTIVARERNMGLGASIRAGVSQVLREHERALVVEDDVVLRPNAMAWIDAALAHHGDDPRLMTLSLWSEPVLVPDSSCAAFFSERFMCWGWVTSRAAWARNDREPAAMWEAVADRRREIGRWGNDLEHMAGRAARENLWYVGYALAHFLHGGLSLFPTETLAVNIGEDGSGTNSAAREPVDAALADRPASWPDRWPEPAVSRGVADAFKRRFSYTEPGPIDRARITLGRWRGQLGQRT